MSMTDSLQSQIDSLEKRLKETNERLEALERICAASPDSIQDKPSQNYAAKTYGFDQNISKYKSYNFDQNINEYKF